MDNRTDEKWYNKEYGMDIKKVLIFVGIVLIIAAAFYTYGALNSERRVPVLPGEVILHGNTSFQYADEKVQKAGYIPTGEVTKVGVATCQMYKSSEAFGYKTKESELIVVAYGRTCFMHYFTDDSFSNNAENPGTTFNTIQEELTSKIGEAPIVEESELHGKVWKWDLRNKTEVDLFYINDGVVLVMYIYKES